LQLQETYSERDALRAKVEELEAATRRVVEAVNTFLWCLRDENPYARYHVVPSESIKGATKTVRAALADPTIVALRRE
jgi:hypothetical protein